MDYEVKADPLEAAFDAAVVTAVVQRPQLAAGDATNPAHKAFVDGYLRSGRDVELKLCRQCRCRWRLCGARGS